MIHSSNPTSDTTLADQALVQQSKGAFFGAERKSLDDIDQSSFAFIGVPFDLGSTGFPGSRLAPEIVRHFSTLDYECIIDLFDGSTLGWNVANQPVLVGKGKKLCDVGNVIVQIGESFDKSFSRLSKVVEAVLVANAMPIIVGGDHSITFGTYAGIKAFHGELGILHLDAHTDLGDWDESTCNNHGNVLTRILKTYNPRFLLQIGQRGVTGQPLLDDRVHTTPDVGHERLDRLEERLKRICGEVPTLVSLDVDLLDPSVAPGTGTPVPGGWTLDHLKKVLSLVCSTANVVALELVEVNPMRDHNDATSQIAAELLFHSLIEL